MARKKKSEVTPKTETYQHPTATVLMRPEMGTQAQFRKHKKPAQYRYDPSLDPALSWDEGGAAREQGEALIREVLEAGRRTERSTRCWCSKPRGRPMPKAMRTCL